MGRRIVVEHADGRRVSVDEDRFDEVEANPFNHPSDLTEYDANSGVSTTRRLPGRPLDDHQSLKAEGFQAVMAIDPEQGWEVPLREDD